MNGPHHFVDPSPDYWTDYTSFQQTKHDLIREYLQGWFPKLTLGAASPGKRAIVHYVDTHAGRGQHTSGEKGSPLVALYTLLEHRAHPGILASSTVRFTFIERDERNAAALRSSLNKLAPRLPRSISPQVQAGDAFKVLRKLSEEGTVENAFVFVDPYGFKIPWQILRELMRFRAVELFVNVMWRELDMAIQQRQPSGHGQARNLDAIFGEDRWRAIGGDSSADRADEAAHLLADRVGAEWQTHVRMGPGGKAVRCFLLHLTNHAAGRKLMKECVWKVCPDGSSYVRRDANTKQLVLLTTEPDLRPLEEWLDVQLKTGNSSLKSLRQALIHEPWLPRHLNEVVNRLEKRGQLVRRADQLERSAQRKLLS